MKSSDIFYRDADHLSFTSEIKQTIHTNNAKSYTNSYRYPYIPKEEVKMQVSKI